MQIVFDRDAAGLLTCNWLRDRCYHFPAVKFVVIAAMAKGVLDPVEGLPNESPNRA